MRCLALTYGYELTRYTIQKGQLRIDLEIENGITFRYLKKFILSFWIKKYQLVIKITCLERIKINRSWGFVGYLNSRRHQIISSTFWSRSRKYWRLNLPYNQQKFKVEIRLEQIQFLTIYLVQCEVLMKRMIQEIFRKKGQRSVISYKQGSTSTKSCASSKYLRMSFTTLWRSIMFEFICFLRRSRYRYLSILNSL